jgi:ribosome-associated toxin RatA of RatAB toxin-antitoxin module
VRSEIGIDIDAEPDLVFALAHGVERWSTLLPHYVRSTARGRDGSDRLVVRFIALRPLLRVLGLGLPVVWAARTWSEPATRRLHFEHIAGATRGMRVTWRIEPRASGGTRVTIEHAFAPPIPGFAAIVDRWFTRPIAGRTLATFKGLAEAVAVTTSTAATSAQAPATNPPA